MDLGSADDSRWLLWSRAKEKSTICKVEGSFTVPEMPRNKGDQVIYISLGVEGSDGTLRTALQWGFNGGSGGPQWGFACWYEDLTGMGDDITVMSCLEPIETGDTLDVRIMRKTIADHTVWACHANARNTGPEATVSIVGDMSPNSCILGLEMYQADLNEPDQYPGSHTRFAKPTLRSSKREIKPLWKSGRHFPDGFPPDPRRPDLSVQNQKSAIVLRY